MVGAVLPTSRASAYRPAGIPLRQHFRHWDTTAWYSQPLERALELVEHIHGDGFWQQVRVLEDNTPSDWLAGFKADKDRAYLFLNQDQSANVFELLHEFGHGVLAYGFGDFDNTKIATDPIFASWRTAICGSQAYQWLESLQGKKIVQVEAFFETKYRRVNQDDVAYFLRWQELFARSYTQYIALVSGDKELLWAVARASNSATRKLLYTSQWQDTDFDQIFDALEALFVLQGWLQ
jgi:hypothetical protein